MSRINLCFFFLLLQAGFARSQSVAVKSYTHADSLRGSLGPERSWWDVQRYDITVKPDYDSRTIVGSNSISYLVNRDNQQLHMQLDLQVPLLIDSIILDKKSRLNFKRDGNAWFVNMPRQLKGSRHRIDIFYQGKVHEAVRAPWDGGWIWAKDSLNRPWMTVACQGLGASVWYPCKDHQSDEPDLGASLTMIVPDTLVAIANGRLQYAKQLANGLKEYKWAVVNPISNYCIIPYIGKYASFKEVYNGEKGKLDLTYWVLDYNLKRGEEYMKPEVHHMLDAFEYWFGPYPFYEDGYQLIETSHTGMEHQSAVSYGNWYKPGYRGRDASGTGWGMKWDFIIIHESGHEWFGNNITTRDLADMWVHEGFTNYSETLFIDHLFGKDAADAYNAGIRRGIRNDKPVIPVYQVNAQGSGDMYPKPSNMLHAIRHGLHDDSLFRKILRGLNKTFYHQTVTTQQVEQYISKEAGFDYQRVFDQYLRTVQVPEFTFYFDADGKRVSYRYLHCVAGFNLPLSLIGEKANLRIVPTTEWQSRELSPAEATLFDKDAIEKMYYLTVTRTEATK